MSLNLLLLKLTCSCLWPVLKGMIWKVMLDLSWALRTPMLNEGNDREFNVWH